VVSSCNRIVRKSEICRSDIDLIVSKYMPTVTQSGGTIRHLRLSLSDCANQRGTLVFAGGLKGPYTPLTYV
jgi:hypothetical protein